MKLTPRLTFLMTIPPLLWAGNAIVGRLMSGQVPPMTLNLLRWLITAALLLPLAWRALRPLAQIRQRLGAGSRRRGRLPAPADNTQA